MPTALQLSREEWMPYVEAASRRPGVPELTPAERRERERLLSGVREAAAVLKTCYSARRVVLFGSLAHKAWFYSDSDVDLAVEGLRGHAYWEAWRQVEDIIGDRSVDLVEIETAGESLRRAIQHAGMEL